MLQKTNEYIDERLLNARALDFTRFIGAKWEAWRNPSAETPSDIFTRRWPKSASLDVIDRIVQRAAVPPATTTSPVWAGPLVGTAVEVSFVQTARAATLLGRLPARKVPLETRVIAGGGSTGFGWAGAGLPKGLTAQSWNFVTLPPAVAATICIISAEVMKLSQPGSIEAVTADLVNGLRAGLDKALVDPAAAGVPGRVPASITNGVTPIASTGDPAADLKALTKAYRDAGGETSTAAILLSSDNAVGLHLSSPAAFPDVTVQGGTVAGLPAFASSALGDQIIMFDVSRLLVADSDAVETSFVTQGTVQMSDAPAAGPQNVVSLWQNDLVGVRIERLINWSYQGGAIAIVNAADYLAAA